MTHPADISAVFSIIPTKSWHCFIAITHTLAGIAVCLSNILLILKIVLLACLVAVFALQWRMVINDKVRELNYVSATGWSIIKNGQLEYIQLLPSTLLTDFLIIIHYRNCTHSKAQTLVCFRDALPRAEYKKLRVLLKLYGLQTNQAK